RSSRGDAGAAVVKPDFLDWWGPRRTAVVRMEDNQNQKGTEDIEVTSCSVGYTAGLVAGWFETVDKLTPEQIWAILAREYIYRKLLERKGDCDVAPRHVQGRGALEPDRMLEE